MKPPPPMLPASGQVTASAKPTATAASTPLPPFARTSSPMRFAGGETLTTMPLVPAGLSGTRSSIVHNASLFIGPCPSRCPCFDLLERLGGFAADGGVGVVETAPQHRGDDPGLQGDRVDR